MVRIRVEKSWSEHDGAWPINFTGGPLDGAEIYVGPYVPEEFIITFNGRNFRYIVKERPPLSGMFTAVVSVCKSA